MAAREIAAAVDSSAGSTAASSDDLRRRALGGVLAVALRGFAVRGMSLAANVVLARKLSPADFGLMAFGLSIVAVGSFFTSGGLGAALLRQDDEPSRRQLEALFGTQLLLASLIAALAVGVGSMFGTGGLLAGIMACSLPLDAFRVPSAVTTQRRLRFGPVVRAEVGEMLVYNIVAVALVLVGLGIWGVGIAVLCRAVTGSTLLILGGSVGILRPRISFAIVRPLLRFGLTLQSVQLVELVRLQGMNFGALTIGGIGVLGIWSFTMRLLQPIILLFEAVAQVAFPAIAGLLRAGDDPRPMLEKGVRLGFGLTGLGTAVLAAATPALVPSVFGEKWNDAIDVIPWCLLGFMLSGPIVASTGSYLAAIGHAGDVARAAALQAVVWFAIAFALLPTLGATAIGVGAAVAGIVEAVYLTRALKAHVDARVVQNALPAVMIAVGAAAIGWLTQAHLEPTLYGAAIAAMAAGCSYILALWVVRADSVREMWQLVRRVAVRG